MTAKRDVTPADTERVQVLGALLAMPALSFGDAALFLDLPRSTLDKLHAQGKGPRYFKIGRRLYVRQADLRAWLDRMADSEAAA